MIWQRIEKAMESGEWRLAEYLGRSLSNSDQVWLKTLGKQQSRTGACPRTRQVQRIHPYRGPYFLMQCASWLGWDGLEGSDPGATSRTAIRSDDTQVRRTN